ncbi:MAG: hypothetical protein PUC29_06860, partial [Clostridia bacterium]|nr:hypothetical protein [Clostridia bacterium]
MSCVLTCNYSFINGETRKIGGSKPPPYGLPFPSASPTPPKKPKKFPKKIKIPLDKKETQSYNEHMNTYSYVGGNMEEKHQDDFE